MEPRLDRVFARYRRDLGTLLHPPGSSALLAVILALGGLEVGLNIPGSAAETLALRSLFTEGLEPFAAALVAMPEPSRPAVLSAIMLLILVLFGVGGWLGVALALDREQPPTSRDWLRGLALSGRALFWAGVIGSALFILMALAGVVAAIAFRAAMRGDLDGWVSYAVPAAAAGAFFLIVVAGLYLISVTVMMAVVAIAEPATAFWRIPARGHEVFRRGRGERFFRHMAWILPLWYALKIALLQLTIPVRPVTGRLLDVMATGGALLHGALGLGDGLVVLFALVLAVELYRAGASPEPRANESE